MEKYNFSLFSPKKYNYALCNFCFSPKKYNYWNSLQKYNSARPFPIKVQLFLNLINFPQINTVVSNLVLYVLYLSGEWAVFIWELYRCGESTVLIREINCIDKGNHLYRCGKEVVQIWEALAISC
jgi:hypothetical protein